MRKLVPIVVLVLCAAAAAAQTIPELFAKAKEQVKAGSWKDALATLDSLDTESQKPGNENVRAQLEAPLAFYRGVCQSNLNLQDKAAENFRVFLKAQPGATIDSAVYGKKTAAAFERAQKDLAERPPSLGEAYKEFRPRPDAAQPQGASDAIGRRPGIQQGADRDRVDERRAADVHDHVRAGSSQRVRQRGLHLGHRGDVELAEQRNGVAPDLAAFDAHRHVREGVAGSRSVTAAGRSVRIAANTANMPAAHRTYELSGARAAGR